MDPSTNQVVKDILKANDCLDRNYIVPELQSTAPGSPTSLCPFVEVSIDGWRRLATGSFMSVDHIKNRHTSAPRVRGGGAQRLKIWLKIKSRSHVFLPSNQLNNNIATAKPAIFCKSKL